MREIERVRIWASPAGEASPRLRDVVVSIDDNVVLDSLGFPMRGQVYLRIDWPDVTKPTLARNP